MRLRRIIIVNVCFYCHPSSVSIVKPCQTAFATSGFGQASCHCSRGSSGGDANPTSCLIPFISSAHGRRGNSSGRAACDRTEKHSSCQRGTERKKEMPEHGDDGARNIRCNPAQEYVSRRGYRQAYAFETPSSSEASRRPAPEISTASTGQVC